MNTPQKADIFHRMQQQKKAEITDKVVFEKFKQALMDFVLCTVIKHFENGEYDELIEKFLNAEFDYPPTFEFNHKVEMVLNDVLLVHLLQGKKPSNPTIKNIKKIWGMK